MQPTYLLVIVPMKVWRKIIRVVGRAYVKLDNIELFVPSLPSQWRPTIGAKRSLHIGRRPIDTSLGLRKSDILRFKHHKRDHRRSSVMPTSSAMAIAYADGWTVSLVTNSAAQTAASNQVVPLVDHLHRLDPI